MCIVITGVYNLFSVSINFFRGYRGWEINNLSIIEERWSQETVGNDVVNVVLIVFDLYEYHVDIYMSRVRPARHGLVRLSFMAKTLTLDITCKLHNQILFIPGMLMGTIDLYHFMPFSLTLTLSERHKVSV